MLFIITTPSVWVWRDTGVYGFKLLLLVYVYGFVVVVVFLGLCVCGAKSCYSGALLLTSAANAPTDAVLPEASMTAPCDGRAD